MKSEAEIWLVCEIKIQSQNYYYVQHCFKMGFRYRLSVKNLIGKPDIVLRKYRTVIFVHGCFWHQHQNCKEGRMPNTKQDYSVPKLTKNIMQDEKNKSELEALGWKIFIVWECQLEKNFNKTFYSLISNFK